MTRGSTTPGALFGALLCLLAPVPAAAHDLETTTAGGLSTTGNMFDLIAVDETVFETLSLNLDSTATESVEILYRQGPYLGYESDDTAWTSLGVVATTGQGAGTNAVVPKIFNLIIPEGETWGFYVRVPSCDCLLTTVGTSEGAVINSVPEISITQGVAIDGDFGAVTRPRIFNGAISYHPFLNLPPYADPKNVVTPQDTPLDITLSGMDPNNDPLTFEITRQPSSGTLAWKTLPDLITYTPDPGTWGPDSFDYRAFDALLYSVSDATVDIAVARANQLPVADAGPVSGGSYAGGEGDWVALDGSGSFDPDGTVTQWDWDCTSDGSYDLTVPVPTGWSCRYRQDGSYTVTLRVTDNTGATRTDTATVEIANLPPETYQLGPTSGFEGVALDFEGLAFDPGAEDVLSWSWDWGEGAGLQPGALTASHAFADNGTYTVRVQADDAEGGVGFADKQVTIANVAPVVTALVAPAGVEGSPVTLSAAASDVAADPLTFTWDFGDGSPVAVGDVVVHTWDDDAAWAVSVTVTDDDGGQEVSGDTVVVANADPQVLWATGDTTGDEAAVLSFSAGVSDPGAADVAELVVTWDFGDGTPTASGTAVQHAFADDGSYDVALTVADRDGGQATVPVAVQVVVDNVPPQLVSSPPPNAVQGATYRYDPAVVDPGDEVFAWTAGPGAPSTLTVHPDTGAVRWTPSFADSLVGAFDVTLHVSDGDGGSDEQTWTITVAAADDDGDGMADDWELAHGLNPADPGDAGADPDFDGLTNLVEYGFDTDPMSWDGPSVPVPGSPGSGVEVDVARPTLHLLPAIDPQGDWLTYDFEIYADPSLTALLTSSAGITQPDLNQVVTWTVSSDLPENSEVFWRARAADPWVASAWSGIESFFVNAVEEPPALPFAVYPIAGEAAASLTPGLQWTAVPDADRDAIVFDVEITDDDEVVVASIFDFDGWTHPPRPWVTDPPLVENRWYAWSVRAVDEHGLESGWTDPEPFFVSVVEEAPAGLAWLTPLDASDLEDVSPTLVVAEALDPEGLAVQTYFELDVSAAFDSPELLGVVVDETGTGSVSWDLAAHGIALREHVDWYARAWAVDEAGVSSAVVGAQFTMRGPNDPPKPPVLIAPGETARVEDLTPVLVWQNTTDPEGDPVHYSVVVALDPSLAEVVARADDLAPGSGPDAEGGHTSWRIDRALEGHFYWSVQAWDDRGEASSWAPPHALEVVDTRPLVGRYCREDGCRGCGGGSPAGLVTLFGLLLALSRRRESGLG